MAVGFASYEIARSGLSVNERGLFVTGHNLSNVNTPGYVRQQAMITTATYQTWYDRNGMYQLGLGADIQQVRQIRHSFLDNVYRQENTTMGYWEARNKTFQDVEAILGEPMSEGLQNTMNQFWDSWQELSKEPDSLTVRALVRQRAEALVHKVNHMGAQLDKLQSDLDSEIRVRIDEVNDITSQIADLNVTILKNEVSGDLANDYRDQRNLLVDRLSKMVNAEVTEMQDGQLSITLGGYFLVNKNVSTRLYAGEDGTGNSFHVPMLEGTTIEVPIKSGSLKGLLESRGEVYGAKGSTENGTPNTKADIVFAVDVSDSSASYLANVKANIASYVAELKKSGIDYNLRLITYGNNVISNTNYGTDITALTAAIPAVPTADTGNNFGGVGGVLEVMEGITDFRPNANKFALVFTDESIDGDGGAASGAGYADRLNAIGMNTSVITNTSYYTAGDPGGESGWDTITNATNGGLYNINTLPANYAAMMTQIGSDTNTDVNAAISLVSESNNIVSDLKQRLNALINIMMREVNYLHSGGWTLDGSQGEPFFVPIDSNYPLEMGNIKLNDNLTDLNKIAASANGDKGDNKNALDIANLRYASVMKDLTGILSIDDYYQGIILQVGNGGSEAANILANQQKLVQSADASRTAITGVSMDEEMTNMMKYKFAYDASSKAINVIDEMIDTIISRMGLVGR